MNPSYTGARSDLLDLLDGRACARVLDVGCANGALGEALKQAFPGSHVTGIELDAEMAEAAAARLDRVLVGDAASQIGALVAAQEIYSAVICGDVLEHLVDPWATLCAIRSLGPRQVIVSLPNVAHLSTIGNLLRNTWPQRDRGIHDRTHLRFFARRDLEGLFEGAGFREVRRVTRHRLLERPHPVNHALEPVLRHLPGLRRYTAYQFLSVLEPA